MQFEERDIADLTPDPLNSRSHDERNLDAIAKSLEKFGQQKPIVIDANGVIRAGNGTCEAAKRLGWTTIGVVVSELEGPDLIAYGIADNKTGDLADWDWEPLSEMLSELQELDGDLVSATGFSDDELDALLSADWTPPKPTGENPARPEKPVEHTLTLSDAAWDAMKAAMSLAREKSEADLTDRPFRDATNEEVARKLFNGFDGWTHEIIDAWHCNFVLMGLTLGVQGVQDRLGHASGMTHYSIDRTAEASIQCAIARATHELRSDETL